jgi:hypothetical protein
VRLHVWDGTYVNVKNRYNTFYVDELIHKLKTYGDDKPYQREAYIKACKALADKTEPIDLDMVEHTVMGIGKSIAAFLKSCPPPPKFHLILRNQANLEYVKELILKADKCENKEEAAEYMKTVATICDMDSAYLPHREPNCRGNCQDDEISSFSELKDYY